MLEFRARELYLLVVVLLIGTAYLYPKAQLLGVVDIGVAESGASALFWFLAAAVPMYRKQMRDEPVGHQYGFNVIAAGATGGVAIIQQFAH